MPGEIGFVTGNPHSCHQHAAFKVHQSARDDRQVPSARDRRQGEITGMSNEGCYSVPIQNSGKGSGGGGGNREHEHKLYSHQATALEMEVFPTDTRTRCIACRAAGET
ncbi:hypothetical protein PBY51_007321 [Eleginops maclovinus]|uniref:Uncharacterized protein n=1 Tax=Eleginops maclovinus TaxID=56733 RepID=A0AAN7X3P7_ELEMC|nr:hypothetical protein PBY51_007321 [Eleginops maclovinus]